MKDLSAADLDKLYTNYESADKSDFATWRSQLLLIAGDHYNRRGNSSWDRIRNFRNFEKTMKLRLTKNHFGKIAERYSNNLISLSPNVKPMPKHEREIQDQKSAELYDAIWQDGQEVNNFQELKSDFADDFMWIGECYAKVYFDPKKGARIGYEQAVDPETGEPLFEQVKMSNAEVDPATGVETITEYMGNGDPIADQTKPVYEGQNCIERIYGFNILYDIHCDGFEGASKVCNRKTARVEDLQKQFPDKADQIAESSEQPFLVFHIDQGYRQSDQKKEVLLKEWYIRPCEEYPNGYWYLHITGLILDEGELPLGSDGRPVFPIVAGVAKKIQTKRRGISPLHPLRAYQSEVNRSASKIGETQITLGDDKLLIQHGTKVSGGTKLPGIRAVTYTGAPPQIMAGRAGTQYLEYMSSQIKEMYAIADLDEEDPTAQLDPSVLLYRAANQKRKFNRYIKKFEYFLKKVCETYLETAKVYFSEDRYIEAVGRSEAVNIAEFKKSEATGVQITVEPSSDDVETRLGKMMQYRDTIQYVGSQLSQDQIGKLLRNAPYANSEDSFSEMTINDENATNDILALDRGELPKIMEYDPHEYMINRATSRMRQPDFKMLNEDIQENYELYIKGHTDVLKAQKSAILREQSGFIPDSGTVVKADYYVRDKANPDDKASRAEFPVTALEWLYNKLDEQNSFKQRMTELPPAVVAGSNEGSSEAQSVPTQMPAEMTQEDF